MTQKTKATRSAAGGAGGLFSCLDFYSRFEGLSQVHARMVSAGVTLNKAVKSALLETSEAMPRHCLSSGANITVTLNGVNGEVTCRVSRGGELR